MHTVKQLLCLINDHTGLYGRSPWCRTCSHIDIMQIIPGTIILCSNDITYVTKRSTRT